MKTHLRKNIVFYIAIFFMIISAFFIFFSGYTEYIGSTRIEYPLYKVIFGGDVRYIVDEVDYVTSFSLNILLTILYIIKCFFIVFIFIIRKDRRNVTLLIVISILYLLVTLLLFFGLYIIKDTIGITTSHIYPSVYSIVSLSISLLAVSLIIIRSIILLVKSR